MDLLLKTGQAAEVGGVSRKALRIYMERGLVEPTAVDEHSGYCYFDIMQSARIDLVTHLQSVGMSLDAIQDVSEWGSISHLREQIAASKAELEQQQRALEVALWAADDMLASCDTALGEPVLDQVMLASLPACKILAFDIDNTAIGTSASALSQPQWWEWMKRQVKQAIAENHWPAVLYRNVGCVISPEKLLVPGAWKERAFVYVDERFSECAEQWIEVPAGEHLVIYRDGSIKPACSADGDVYIERLLDYAQAKGLEPCGALLIDSVCDYQHLLSPKMPALQRYRLPVKRSARSSANRSSTSAAVS